MVHGREDLADRIQRLERDARRWRLAAVALAGVLGMVGLVGATTAGRVPIAEEIRARRFTLVDEAGRTRAELRVSEARDEGGAWAGLTVYNEAGSRLLDVGGGLETNAAAVTLYERTGVVRASLVGSPRHARLLLMHPRGEAGGIDLQAHEHGALSLFFSDARGYARAGLVMDSRGSPYLRLNTARDLGYLILGAEELGPVGLRVHDERGQVRAVLGPSTLRTTRTGVVEQRPASSLVLFDKDGEVLFKAP